MLQIYYVFIFCPSLLRRQEPILNSEQPAFQYSSHVSLQAPSGHMWSVPVEDPTQL